MVKTKKENGLRMFFRLLIYFLIILILPLIGLGLYFTFQGEFKVLSSLQENAKQHIVVPTKELSEKIEEYRHKIYTFSTSQNLIDILDGETDFGKEIYSTMYSIMEGDTYLATVTAVSLDGKIRLSTHKFREKYDLRYMQGVNSPFFEIDREKNDKATLMRLDNRYNTDRNELVVLSLFRKIFSDDGNLLGYCVLDIFANAMGNLTDNGFFKDIILIDTTNYQSASLVDPNFYDNLEKYPEIDLSKIGKVYEKTGRVIALEQVKGTPFVVAGVIETDSYIVNYNDISHMLFAVVAIGFLISVIAALFLSRNISKPIDELVSTMNLASDMGLEIEVKESNIREIRQLDKSFNSMIIQIKELLEMYREEEEQLREAERKALEAQMNPHFLYNTLNTIKSIAKLHGEDEIHTIAVKLGKLLRSSIDTNNSTATLKESFILVDSYLQIQKIRFRDKLDYNLDLPQELENIVTPKLIVQPLVENSIIHGLETKIGKGNIFVKAYKNNEDIFIEIEDDGIGFDQNKIPSNDVSHVGIDNIKSRLKICYGKNCSLDIKSERDKGTKVIIKIPFDSDNYLKENNALYRSFDRRRTSSS